MPASIKKHLHHLYKKAETKDHPLQYLFLEITRTCNLTCRHCGSDCASKTFTKELTTASWLKILDDIGQSFSPMPTMVLSGGEPLIHPDIKVITKKMNSLGIQWGLVSNGYALNTKKLSMLLDNGMKSITISLDGKENSHNWLRGKSDSYEKAVQAIGLVSESNVPLKDVVTCVNPKNLHELNDIAHTLINNGMTSWRLFRIFPAGRAQGNASLLMSNEQTKEMLNWIQDRKPDLIKCNLDLNLSCEGWLPFSTDVKLRNQPFFCRSGINIASILADGTITGCSNNASQFYQGNVLTDRLAFVWQHKFETLRNRKWVNESECGECSHCKDCNGSSMHLWRSGFKKPEFCYMECF